MAAGGGVFLSENMVLPGAYINFISKARASAGIGERGIAALALNTGWSDGGIVHIYKDDFLTDSVRLLGFSYDDEEMTPLREIFKNAAEVLLYCGNSGENAAGEIGELSISAAKGGVRGNSIKAVVKEDVDIEGYFVIKTYIDGIEADSQRIKTTEEFIDNGFITLNGSLNVGSVNLSGGSSEGFTGKVYSDFLRLIEGESFTAVLYDGEDSATKSVFEGFVKRLRDEEGYKVTAVLYDCGSNYEGVTNLCGNRELIYWTAGALAGAEINESLTNMAYDGELTPYTAYTKAELREAVKGGKFIFYNDRGKARVLKDINSYCEVSKEKNSDFGNNQVIRVLDAIGNDIGELFGEYYLGKMQNDSIGRDIFKSDVIDYCTKLMGIRAIEEFDSEDVSVLKGSEKGDVIVNLGIMPVAAMDKIYMTCVVA